MDDVGTQYVLEEGIQVTASTRIRRGYRRRDGQRIVVKVPRSEYPSALELAQLRHEHALLGELGAAPVAHALELVRFDNGIGLVLEDAGVRSFDRLLPIADLARFLRLATLATAALEAIHSHGIIHKDIKPQHFFVDEGEGRVLLIDFGIATTLHQEEQRPENLDTLEGTLAYISPEQTGRMNRSVDRRSDLYSLGVTLYQLLTGVLPFEATDPLELVHSHIARSPRPPAEVKSGIPPVVSDLVLRLLEKVAEDRYQTAAGLRADLLQCQARLSEAGTIEAFPLGREDHSGELDIPQKLYGREADAEVLVAAFERAKAGARELLLISGHSGIGKSALVHELHKQLIFGGHFVLGKFDQFNKSVPYSAVARALGELVRAQLASSADQLEKWKQDVLLAVGENGRLLIDIIPELALVIGAQPVAGALGPNESQNRFERLFQRFLSTSASAECPLLIFLDDLQWADAASLRLLRLLLLNPEQRHLLVIGSYRDNEVNALHPLSQWIEELSPQLETPRIRLQPLGKGHIEQLLAETFPHRAHAIEPLADLLARKTGGNPFFLAQFLEKAVDAGLLSFAPGPKLWTWQLDKIEAAGITDNVVDLVLEKLRRLDTQTQSILKYAACIGHRFDAPHLSTVSGSSVADVARGLRAALSAGLVAPLDRNYRLLSHHADPALAELEVGYRFTHDRVQQAAYALIPAAERGPMHLLIGRLLLSSSPEGEPTDENLFEVVNALNLGCKHITDSAEQRRLAALDVRAAERAKSAAAPAAACELVEVALRLLGEAAWVDDYALAYRAQVIKAECSYLTGNEAAAFASIETLKSHAKSLLERVRARNLETLVLTNQSRLSEALSISVETIRMFGVGMPEPTDRATIGQAIGAEFGAYQAALAQRSIESLADIPSMSDPEKLALVDTLGGAMPAAFQSNSDLMPLIVLKAVQLPLEHGTAPLSSFFYEMYGVVHAVATGDHETAYRFGQLGLRLSERADHQSARGAVQFIFGCFNSHWRRPLSESLVHLEQGVRAGLDAGDQVYAGYCIGGGTMYRLYAGEPLERIAADIPGYIQALTVQKDVINLGFLTVCRQTIRCLAGETAVFGQLDDAQFSEATFEASGPPPLFPMYGAHKAMVRYLAGDAAAALEATERFQPLPILFYNAEYKLYHALALAQLARAAEGEARSELLLRLGQDIEVHARWAASCAANFAHRHTLLRAELDVLNGHTERAMSLFDQAITEATAHGFVQHVALASELCGRFHHAAGRRRVARSYLLEARYQYERWGALGKAAQLVRLYPDIDFMLVARETAHTTHQLVTDGGSRTATLNRSTGGGLDLMSAMRATQAIASELVLDRLVERLLRILVENAGAQSGFLILRESAGLRLTAAIRVDPDRVELGLDEALDANPRLASSIVQFVARSKEPVVLDDASQPHRFSRDAYLEKRATRSLLCMPLLHQGELSAILYLENSAIPGAFTAARIERLQFLGSHAAVAIENAKLYGQVQAATRRLEEANDTLEHKVQDRTAELRGRNQDMRRVLDNVTQGLITVDLEGRVSAERSAITERWFGAFARASLFADHMSRIDTTFADWFAMAFQTLLDGFMTVDLCLEQFPTRLVHGEREYHASYSAIHAGEQLTGLLIVIADVTDALRSARAEEVQKEQLALFQKLAQDRVALLGFFEEGSQMVEQLQTKTSDGPLLKRLLHTLKGNAGMMGLSLLAQRCHAAEDAIVAGKPAAESYAGVLERWADLVRTRDMLVGERGQDSLEVAHVEVQRLLEALKAGVPANDLAQQVERWRLEPLQRPLQRLGEHARSIAERLGKAEFELEVSDAGLAADPVKGRPLWSVLVHMVRNAVDHGCETPEERSERGKPSHNRLRLAASLQDGSVVIEIADDGRGIDWARVRTLAEQRGLPSTTADDLLAALLAPDLSTRSEVSATSGRGIGLAAVEQEVTALGGTLAVQSETGSGCSWSIRVPSAALGAIADAPGSQRRARLSTPPERAAAHP
ncbi:MAG: AAA family ATPase [Deltaproteobacteria bacterium]